MPAISTLNLAVITAPHLIVARAPGAPAGVTVLDVADLQVNDGRRLLPGALENWALSRGVRDATLFAMAITGKAEV